ncbi:hypothetical protein LEP1GSC068_0511 [Leptospira sp. Fiocruz LV3954]|nr:hypothetical protein LEP1GSC068_0511 [Leptospira sp. Fiocruz LV3954]EMI68036.1 hypothetical protein LEP1GSC076_0202 [Leptospira sp. Fiocruz LV4135]
MFFLAEDFAGSVNLSYTFRLTFHTDQMQCLSILEVSLQYTKNRSASSKTDRGL